eukprot:scaffold89854_cov51-Phaeocystis_antarctica.AAC.2
MPWELCVCSCEGRGTTVTIRPRNLGARDLGAKQPAFSSFATNSAGPIFLRNVKAKGGALVIWGHRRVCCYGLVTISLPPSSAWRPPSRDSGARALAQMPGANRSSAAARATTSACRA